MYKLSVTSSHYQEDGADFTLAHMRISLISEDDLGNQVVYGPYSVFR